MKRNAASALDDVSELLTEYRAVQPESDDSEDKGDALVDAGTSFWISPAGSSTPESSAASAGTPRGDRSKMNEIDDIFGDVGSSNKRKRP